MIYIALLRGINVSGQKMIKMADLIKICDSLGFHNTSTYLQSGNIVFEHETADPVYLEGIIEKAILDKYHFEVKVIVRTMDEFENIVTGNPLIDNPEIDTAKLHVTFLRGDLKGENAPEIQFTIENNESFIIKDREIYLYCPNGYGNTKLNNQAFERKLKTVATTRNWKTVRALLEIAKQKNK